ncbi:MULTISPECIES: tetratricopeptide repeat protein [unclassified Undibacterium]|uniref:tetratricopeptide repeat protein n=1 Tax=unclassified Undibacterium TaxID=2630295 RepID=UPI002AC98948|nr:MULTISPECIES: tetratricopeptide repeat protein [unclassified Undibacterium]MEB0137559.1 tetratricopeptide repeat protein [Undibacterium sp. CCC2.1]MEB0170560.1 tetratricopeptide repeat protein [Undibacterium sp. CCC1.1]MEB0174501.1 tetratricopeptide repeat protein [Undibacterium sp. CCC3.4]MEB0213702.1 tetratricopeptide repeat protein [Undibacterium sp. 5I2]WPX43867.1 tetratricopeptide repeat protein [Undibacterium sp. CCC3.4]
MTLHTLIRLCTCLFAALLLPVAAADLQSEGRVLLSQGDNLAASKKFSEAAKQNPFDGAALNNQALAYAAQGEYEQALALLERAVRVSPQRADIAANLQEMRQWIARHAPSVGMVAKSTPIINVYPDSTNDLPPEPPALWKK